MSLLKSAPSVLCICLAITSSIVSVGFAQSIVDFHPPVIELEENTEGTAGEAQVFTALVADDQSLKDVKLYYRFAGQQSFSSITMEPLANTGYFTTNLPTNSSETRAIEYYIQARDNGGNRVVQGFAFNPLIRQLKSPTVAAQSPKSGNTNTGSPAPANSEPGINWWYVALGVLATGAVVALASDGGSDNSGSSNTLVPFNLTVTNPPLDN